jgi:hypothetical protein
MNLRFLPTLLGVILLSFRAFSQTISPGSSHEICPHPNYSNAQFGEPRVERFEIDLAGVEVSNWNITNQVACKIVRGLIQIGGNPSKADCYVAFEDQRAKTPEFTITSTTNQSKTFKFPKIRSLNGLKPELQFLTPMNLPICSTGNVPYNFSKLVRYKSIDDNTEFGNHIPLYEYSVPKGWKVENTVSTGPNNYILAAPGATITFDEIHSGEIKIRASASGSICHGTPTLPVPGAWVNIPFTRPTLRLTANGSTSLPLSCGVNGTYTFSLENANDLSCLTYQWNLGTSSNNWTYNGTPAPQFISTTTNAITLSTNTCTGTPTSVSVTAKMNNVDIETFTIPVTLNIPEPSISGSLMVCNTDQFTVAPLSCTPSILWEPQNGKLMVIGGQGTPTATMLKMADGTESIKATIMGVCGNTFVKYLSDVQVGTAQAPVITHLSVDEGRIEAFVEPFPGVNSYNWYKNGDFYENTPHPDISIWKPREECDVGYEIGVEAVSACGTSARTYGYISYPCQNLITLAPNPASTTVYISLEQKSRYGSRKGSLTSYRNVTQVRIFDATFKLRQQQQFSSGSLQVMVNIVGLPAGIYFIEVYSGAYKETKKLVIHR